MSDTNDTTEKNQKVVNAVVKYREEANSACVDRMSQNRENFDTYHLRADWSYKKKGQSKEFLAKQANSVEQLTSFIQQGLADLGEDWYSMGSEEGAETSAITLSDMKMLLDRQLKKAGMYTMVGDSLKCGFLGSLMVCKVNGKVVSKPRYITKQRVNAKGQTKAKLYRTENKTWQLALDVVSPKDIRPDPSGRGLYILEDIEMDLHEVKALVKSKDNPDGIYDAEAVENLRGDMAKFEKETEASRESGQNVAQASYRKRVSITECWGTILDENGDVMYENVVCAVANDRWLIRPPQENPFWHNMHPYVISPIIRVPHSVWHKALMDAPTKHNKAMNELYNLILDSGLMAVYGISQLRTDWLQDATLIDDGVSPGQTLEVNSQCPPGAKVFERVDTAQMSPEALNVFQITDREYQQAALTNDARLGVTTGKASATEIVESSQSITGMLNGIAKTIETEFIEQVLMKAWMTVAQHIDDLNSPEVQKLLGRGKAAVLAQLSPEEIFAQTVNGLTFQVFGITNTMNKQKDFRRIVALLQTIAGSEVLVEKFAEKYDFGKLLTEIMKSLDINEGKIRLEGTEEASADQPVNTAAVTGGPNVQSQIPQVAAAVNDSPETVNTIAQPKFPPSRATPRNA